MMASMLTSASVAFVADRKLKRIPVEGGSVTTICEVPGSVRGGTWGDDHTIIFATSSGGLQRVADGGGRAEPITTLGNEFTQRWPQFLPGAKAVLFTSHRYPAWFDRARIDVLSLADGRRKTIQADATFGRFAAGPDGQGYLTFVRAGTLFAALTSAIDLK